MHSNDSSAIEEQNPLSAEELTAGLMWENNNVYRSVDGLCAQVTQFHTDKTSKIVDYLRDQGISSARLEEGAWNDMFVVVDLGQKDQLTGLMSRLKGAPKSDRTHSAAAHRGLPRQRPSQFPQP